MGSLRQRHVLSSVGAKRRKSWLLAASALAPLSLSLGVSELALAACSSVTTSRARTARKFLSSGLLATIALLAASTVSAHAQSNWTGAFSNGWFNFLNWSAGVPGVATSANIDTVTPNSTEIMGASATALNLAVGQNGTGRLVIQNGGTLTNIGGFIGNLPGSTGTVTVSGTWTNVGTLVVGGLGTGTLTIQDGGTVSSGGGGSIGLAAGSTGTVTVTGPGSTWNNSPVSPGGLNIGSFGNGSLTIV
jgi:T5SS/PEP-CTERM-associated repeat protein